MLLIYCLAVIGAVSLLVVLGYIIHAAVSDTMSAKYYKLRRENEELREKLDDCIDELYLLKWIKEKLKEEGITEFSHEPRQSN